MKTLKLFFLISLLLIIQNVYCDVIPDNSHYVDKCVKITNLSDYSDISLIGYVAEPMSIPTYFITTTNCLTKGYKYNTLYIFAVENSYLSDKDITIINWLNDDHAIKSNIQIECNGEYLPNSSPISSINQFYRIVGFTETSMVLYKWMEVNKFNNGKLDSIITYTYEGDSTLLSKKLILKVPSNQNNSAIELYPNPVKKNFYVKLNNNYQGIVSVKMHSSDGKVVSILNTNKSEKLINYSIPVENLSKGIYFVTITMGEAIETKKIFID